MSGSNTLWPLMRRPPRTSTLFSTSTFVSTPASTPLAFLNSSINSIRGTRNMHNPAVSAVAEGGTAVLSPRWLSDVKVRLGKCIMFGLKNEQLRRAGQILTTVGKDWRQLVVGSEGFLTSKDRAGLMCHNVVWGEMDIMGHVNNVLYVRYAESARVNWVCNIGLHVDPANKNDWGSLMTPSGCGLILRSMRTDYKFPMTWPDKVSVYHKLREPPTLESTAFQLDVVIMSERYQRPAARCEEDIVMYDYQVGKKTPMKPFMVKVFKDLYRDQEEAKTMNTARVLHLLKQVEALEKESWDRPDAKEDLGSAA